MRLSASVKSWLLNFNRTSKVCCSSLIMYYLMLVNCVYSGETSSFPLQGSLASFAYRRIHPKDTARLSYHIPLYPPIPRPRLSSYSFQERRRGHLRRMGRASRFQPHQARETKAEAEVDSSFPRGDFCKADTFLCQTGRLRRRR
jgi:hypothetical protein